MPLCKYHDRGAPRIERWGWVDRSHDLVWPVVGDLGTLLRMEPSEREAIIRRWEADRSDVVALDQVSLIAPVDRQEIWAAGVTYERSRDARMEESSQQDVYQRVYDAERPEIFFKSQPERCIGPNGTIAIRHDSDWNVPEPELAVIMDTQGRISGYAVGNDVSSRSIEGENPLYLPQAKVFSDSCSLGPWIVFPHELGDPLALGIRLIIERPEVGGTFWSGEASTSQLHRTLDELAECLYAALDFPDGSVLLSGTCIVPPAEFTLAAGDIVTIEIDEIGSLVNDVRVLALRS